MVEKTLVKKPVATIARMIKFKKKSPGAIVLPADFIENLEPKDAEKKWALTIFAPKANIIWTIPTKSQTVIKVSIEWSQIVPNTPQELGEVFMRNNIKILYSTGLCFQESSYPYIGFIDSCDLLISEDQLRTEILALTNVTNVKLSKCSLHSFCM
ncbi:MAG: hypothetical protein ACFE8U_03100 [Candidatus Hermodarchaeota archaeon]